MSDSNRPDAKRFIAEAIAEHAPQIFCIHGIDAGDAFALATRFDCGWAYRGAQALFWNADFVAHDAHDRYLPAPPLRPFERRGLLEVCGTHGSSALTLVATHFAPDRSCIRELRFARTALRRIAGRAILFVAGADRTDERIGFRDLGFAQVRCADTLTIYVRDVVVSEVKTARA